MSDTKTNVQLGQISDSILDLCKTDKVDVRRLRQSVNTALTEMQHSEGDDVAKGKLAYKPATKKNTEVFKLTEGMTRKFTTAGSSAPLRFYFWNQEVLRVEQTTGTMSFGSFPSWLKAWAEKFATAEESAPVQGEPSHPEHFNNSPE